MSIKVYIPSLWRNLTGREARLEVEASDIAGSLESLEVLNPGFKSHVMNEKGEFSPYIIIFINQEVVSPGLSITLNEGDEVAFLPVLAGDGI